MIAIACLGFSRVTDIEININTEDIKNGYMKTDCFECNGTGIWDFYPSDYTPTKDELICVDCKGTGAVFINC